MKRLVLILSALALVAFVAIPTPAQDTIININHGRPAQTTLPPVYAAAPAPVYAPAYAAPAPALYAGTGCRGQQMYQGSGCVGRKADVVYFAVPARGGCVGKSGGGCYGSGSCYGSAAFAPGYAQMAYAPAPAEAPVYAAPIVYAWPRPFAYAADGTPIPRGAPRGDGKYATESGKPLPPGVVPWDGPIIGTVRDAAGYNRRR